MPFDIYACADYSASSPVGEQRKHIVLATFDRASGTTQITKGISRVELWVEMCLLLNQATSRGQKVVFGFDHSYSFPTGFYETLTGTPWNSWAKLLQLLRVHYAGVPRLGEPMPPALKRELVKKYKEDPFALESLEWLEHAFQGSSLPREWAESVNNWFRENHPRAIIGGPFWGPNFQTQVTKPQFPFGQDIHERRLVEEYCQRQNRKTMKTIYQIGGNGSVGLQTLFGISYLHQLLLFCEHRDIPIFCWPFDGWTPANFHHVLVEVYPTLYNSGQRSDEEDAKACVDWLRARDEEGMLLDRPPRLTESEDEVVRVEGWVPGVKT